MIFWYKIEILYYLFNSSIKPLVMSPTECGICLEVTPSPIITPCQHKCCNKCLTHWLLQKDSCPMCRHEIGDSSSHSHDDVDSLFNNIAIHFSFVYDQRIYAEGGLCHCMPLITDLISSQINGDNLHLWAIFNDPEYFEYNFRKKKMVYNMTCRFDGKYNVFVEINFIRVQPFINPKKRNQKWVFKSKSVSKSVSRKMRKHKM